MRELHVHARGGHTRAEMTVVCAIVGLVMARVPSSRVALAR